MRACGLVARPKRRRLPQDTGVRLEATIAPNVLELEQNMIRRLLLKLLSGDKALKMEVTSFPLNEDIANAQVTLQKAMSEAFTGNGALNVLVKNDGAAS
jgi:hypothetical protein